MQCHVILRAIIGSHQLLPSDLTEGRPSDSTATEIAKNTNRYNSSIGDPVRQR